MIELLCNLGIVIVIVWGTVSIVATAIAGAFFYKMWKNW